MRLPTNNPITLPYGATTAPYSPSSPHTGTDFAYLPDDTIYAVESGQVTLVPNNGKDGNGLYMRVDNRFWGYLHTSKYLVQNGEWVQEGQPIAIMGSTGAAQGKHLHLALKINKAFVDPMSLLRGTDMKIATQNQAAEFIRAMFKREPTVHEITDLIGRDYEQASVMYRTSASGVKVAAQVNNFPKLEKENAELQQRLLNQTNPQVLKPGIYEVV